MTGEINNAAPEKKAPWFLSRAAVIWGLLIVGPFAAPLLWLSPAFSKKAKIIITVIAAVLTYASVVYTPVFLDLLTKRVGGGV